MLKYAIEIIYSEEDEGYIAIVPELPGCSAFGETLQEALKEIEIAAGLWIETAREDGLKIPVPRGRGLLEGICEGASGA